MAEGGNQSRYVKLTKDQATSEDIRPGELNQPIDVPQVSFYLCIFISRNLNADLRRSIYIYVHFCVESIIQLWCAEIR